jgi:amino acid transporter
VKKATVILIVVITAVLFIGAVAMIGKIFEGKDQKVSWMPNPQWTIVEDNGNKRIIEIGFCVDGSMKWRPSKVMSDDEIIK